MESKLFQESLGLAITSLRERVGLSASDLAKRINISKSKLSRIECGHSLIDLMTLIAISNALNIKIDDIIDLARVFEVERNRPLEGESKRIINTLRKKLIIEAVSMT